jgi:hypothetical protein
MYCYYYDPLKPRKLIAERYVYSLAHARKGYDYAREVSRCTQSHGNIEQLIHLGSDISLASLLLKVTGVVGAPGQMPPPLSEGSNTKHWKYEEENQESDHNNTESGRDCFNRGTRLNRRCGCHLWRTFMVEFGKCHPQKAKI